MKRRRVTVSPSKAPGIPRSAVYFEDCLWRSAGIYFDLTYSARSLAARKPTFNRVRGALPPRPRGAARRPPEARLQRRFHRQRAAAPRARSGPPAAPSPRCPRSRRASPGRSRSLVAERRSRSAIHGVRVLVMQASPAPVISAITSAYGSITSRAPPAPRPGAASAVSSMSRSECARRETTPQTVRPEDKSLAKSDPGRTRHRPPGRWPQRRRSPGPPRHP